MYYYPKSERVLAIPYEEISSKIEEIKKFLKIEKLNVEYNQDDIVISFYLEIIKDNNFHTVRKNQFIIIKENGTMEDMDKIDFKESHEKAEINIDKSDSPL